MIQWFGRNTAAIEDLRREVNALQGLLYFSAERRYPETVRAALLDLIGPKLDMLERLSLQAGGGPASAVPDSTRN